MDSLSLVDCQCKFFPLGGFVSLCGVWCLCFVFLGRLLILVLGGGGMLECVFVHG